MVTYPTRYRATKEKSMVKWLSRLRAVMPSWMLDIITGFGGSKNETV